MAEALAVVSVVANIIQLVDFGTRVLSRLEQYQSTVAEVPEAFRHIKTELPVLLLALSQTKAASDAGQLGDTSKRALLQVIEGCTAQIKALDGVIEKALPAPGDSWTSRGKKAIRSLRYDAKVERITRVIRGYVQTLTYHAAASSKPSAGHTLPPPTPSSTVPFPRDDDFVTRDSLNEIRQICARPAGRAALVGLGGVGWVAQCWHGSDADRADRKSQIAIEYAYQVRDESPATWVFWVHVGTRARFEEAYRRIAEATKMKGWDDPKADILRLVRSWLCDESNGRWLIVVDNADDASIIFQDMSPISAAGSLNESAELLSDFLPQSPNGSILVTSRSRDVAYKLTGAYPNVIEVKPMGKGDALALLQKKLGSHNEDEAMELIDALDCMPLAISQAAAFIKQRAPRMSLSKYVEEVRRSDHDRARLLKKDVGDNRRDGRASNSIIATWQISFEHIRKNTPTAARLLSLMSMFDRQGIPESLLHDRYGGNEDEEADFDDDIYTLTSYSLIGMGADGAQFEMHRLVQFSTKKWLELNNELELWQAKYATLMDDKYPHWRHQNWEVCQALSPHAQAVMQNRPKDTKALEAWASVLYKAAWYANNMGQYSKAYEMGFAAFQARETILGAEHPSTLDSLNFLGVHLDDRGQHSEAEVMHRRALEARKRVLGANEPETLTSMHNLASTYWHQGRWTESEELDVHVLEIRKKQFGPDHPDTIASLNGLARTYWKQGRCKKAEELEVQVVEIRKKMLGTDHPATLSSINNLASTYWKQGRSKEAAELEVQVLEIRKRMLGVGHPDTWISMNNLACTWKDQGRDAEAMELMRECVRLGPDVLGSDHPYYLGSLKWIARWEAEQLKVSGMSLNS